MTAAVTAMATTSTRVTRDPITAPTIVHMRPLSESTLAVVASVVVVSSVLVMLFRISFSESPVLAREHASTIHENLEGLSP